MFSFLTLFISVAAAAGISYFLHTLDRENNSFEKVKRYADKRQGEFDAWFQQQEKKLTSNTANLETKFMQSTAAVKRLESQIAEFQKMTENLSGDTNAVKKIEQEIDSYAKVINELMDMTARVEQNLENVKKESLIIDSLQNKLGEQKKYMEGLEKKIPQISNEFATKNGEQLKLIGNRLLTEYDNHGQKIKEDLLKIEENAKKTMSDFQREINEV